MCGISGSFGRALNDSEIEVFQLSISHRGPDEQFVWKNLKSTLLVSRLAIQDIQTQHQPFFSENKNIVCIFNGEIYNHNELRKMLESKGHTFQTKAGDGEVIVHLYEEFGIDSFRILDGMFALCILDLDKNDCILARDLFGIKPLYFSIQDSCLTFSSEIGIFLDRQDKKIRKKSIIDYLQEGFLHSPYSILDDVQQVNPGSYIKFNTTSNSISNKTWPIKINDEIDKKMDLQKAAESVLEILHESVKSQVPTELDFGCFLSGGIDSSLIAKLASAHSKKKILTFSAHFPELEKGGKKLDEHWSNYVSQLIQSEHHSVEITSNDVSNNFEEIVKAATEPFGGVFTSYFLSKYASSFVKVCLTGDGADELFGGYLNSRIAYVIDQARTTVARQEIEFMEIDNILYWEILKNNRNEYTRRRTIARFYGDDVALKRENLFFREDNNLIGSISARARSLKYPLKSKFRESLAWDLFHLLPNNVLFYADRFSMYSSLEIRPPFLTKRMLEFVSRIPDNFLIRQFESKKILKIAASAFFPEEMIYRKKEGFISPVDYWLRHPLKEWSLSKLLEPHPAIDEFVNFEYVRELAHRLMQNEGDYRTTRQIWKIIVLKEWFNTNRIYNLDQE